jgi:hypothetical protein
MKGRPNKIGRANRRPASPFNAGRQFGSPSCAPPFLSAAVAHLWRWQNDIPQQIHIVKKQIIRSLLICSAAFVFAGCTKNPGSYISEQTQSAEAGNRWAQFYLWDAYHKGTHGVDTNQAESAKWLDQFVKGVYVVRIEPANGFHPKNAKDYRDDIRRHTPEVSSAKNGVGTGSFFRTKKEGNKLAASFLTDQPDKLQAYIESNPDLKFISAEAMTPQSFIEYERTIQESL